MPLTHNEAKADLDDMYDDLNRSRSEGRPRSDWAVEKASEWGLREAGIGAWGATSTLPVDDPTRVQVRRKVFDSISNSIPPEEKDSLPFWDRVGLQNLIDERPDLQEKYLIEKGFDTKIDEGRVLFKKPDEVQFSPVDPEGWDWMDIADSIDDFADTVVEWGALTSKTIGKVAGPLGKVAGPVVAGGAMAGAEAVKQGIGVATGFREEFDAGDIGQAFTEGAGGEVVGKAFDFFTFGPLRKLFGKPQTPRADLPEIEEAERIIGAELPPGKKMKEGTEQRVREALLLKEDEPLSDVLMQSIKSIEDAKADFVEDFAKRSGLDSFTGGKVIKDKIELEFGKRLEDIEWKYNKLDMAYNALGKLPKGKRISPDTEILVEMLQKTRDENMRFQVGAEKIPAVFQQLLVDADTLTDMHSISALRTRIRKLKKNVQADDTITADALDDAYNAVTVFRSAELEKMADAHPEILGGGILPDGTKSKNAADILKEADTEYWQFQESVRHALGQRGKAGKKESAKDILIRLSEMEPEKVAKKVLTDLEHLAEVKQNWPATFQSIKNVYEDQLFKSAKTGALKSDVTAKSLVRAINSQDDVVKKIMLEEDDVLKTKAMTKILNVMDEKDVTPKALRRWYSMSYGVINALSLSVLDKVHSAGRASLYEFQLGKLAQKVGIALTKTGGKRLNTLLGTQGLEAAFSPSGSSGIRRAIPNQEDPFTQPLPQNSGGR